MLRFFFNYLFGVCWYHDEIIQTEVVPSPWEQRHPAAVEVKEGRMDLLPWIFTRPITTIVRCSKCGRIKHVSSAKRP